MVINLIVYLLLAITKSLLGQAITIMTSRQISTKLFQLGTTATMLSLSNLGLRADQSFFLLDQLQTLLAPVST